MPDAAKSSACFDDFGIEAFFAEEMEEIDSGKACADDASIELYVFLVIAIEVAICRGVSLATKVPLHGVVDFSACRLGIDM